MNEVHGFTQILQLFNRRIEDVRFLNRAEAAEYTALLLYLVRRSQELAA